MTISEWKEDFKSFINELNIPRDDYKGIIAYIDEVPEHEWISCSERMPEYYKPVLTFDGKCYGVEQRIPFVEDDKGIIEGVWWVDTNFVPGESEFYPGLREGTAIAWMPLPEPYEKMRGNKE